MIELLDTGSPIDALVRAIRSRQTIEAQRLVDLIQNNGSSADEIALIVERMINAYKRAAPPGQELDWLISLAQLAGTPAGSAIGPGILRTLPGTLRRAIANGRGLRRDNVLPLLVASIDLLLQVGVQDIPDRIVNRCVLRMRTIGVSARRISHHPYVATELRRLVVFGGAFLRFEALGASLPDSPDLARDTATALMRFDQKVATLARSGHWQRAWALQLAEPPSSTVESAPLRFATLIRHAPDDASASGVFEHMIASGKSPDEPVMTALASVVSYESLIEIPAKFVSLGQSLVPEAWDILVRRIVREWNGPVKPVFEKLMQAPSAIPPLAPHTYGRVLAMLTKRGEMDMDGARWMYAHMIENGIVSDGTAFSWMMQAEFRNGNPSGALEIWRQMQEKGIKADGWMLSLMIYSLCNAGRLSDALVIFEAVRATGVKPHAKSVDRLVAAACRQGTDAMLRRVLEIIEGFAPSPETRLDVIAREIYSQAGEALPKMLSEVASASDLSTSSLCRIASAEQLLGNVRGAREWYERALARAQDELGRAYSLLGLGMALVRLGEREKAVEVLSEVVARYPGFARVARLWLVRVLNELERYDEALGFADGESVDRPDSDPAQRHFLRATAYWARARKTDNAADVAAAIADARAALQQPRQTTAPSARHAGHPRRDAARLVSEIASKRGFVAVADVFTDMRIEMFPYVLRALAVRGVFDLGVLRPAAEKMRRLKVRAEELRKPSGGVIFPKRKHVADSIERAVRRIAVALGRYVSAWWVRAYVGGDNSVGGTIEASARELAGFWRLPELWARALRSIPRDMQRCVSNELAETAERLLSQGKDGFHEILDTKLIGLFPSAYGGAVSGLHFVSEFKELIAFGRGRDWTRTQLTKPMEVRQSRRPRMVAQLSHDCAVRFLNEFFIKLDGMRPAGLRDIRAALEREQTYMRVGIRVDCADSARVASLIHQGWQRVGERLGPRPIEIDVRPKKLYVKLFLWARRKLPPQWPEIERMILRKEVDERKWVDQLSMFDILETMTGPELAMSVRAMLDASFERVMTGKRAEDLLQRLHTFKNERLLVSPDTLGDADDMSQLRGIFAQAEPRSVRWFDLQAVLQRVIDKGFGAAHKHVEWELVVPEQEARIVRGAQGRLLHAIKDVLHNCLDALASLPEGEAKRVRICLERSGDDHCVTIESSAHERLTKGTGLGKKNVERIMEDHRGRVEDGPLPDGRGYAWRLTWPPRMQRGAR